MNAPWLKSGQEKRHSVCEMFAEIAPVYDVLNNVMSFSMHQRWRMLAVRKLNLKQGDHVLDICCGTGSFIEPIFNVIRPGGRITGIDFCSPMLERCQRKFDDQVDLVLGDACQLPFGKESFDGVTVGWGIRNVYDIDKAHSEAYRVLKKGAIFVSIDMARPTHFLTRFISEVLFHRCVPLLWAILGKAKAGVYLPKSTERFLNREELKFSMEQAGFTDVMWQDLFGGNICMHWGKKQ